MTPRQTSFSRRRALGAARCEVGPELEPLEPRSLLAALPLVTLSVADPNAAEHNMQLGKFAITRTVERRQPAHRGVHRRRQPPRSGADYIAARFRGTATIPAGRSTLIVPVIPIDDLLVEGPENVRLILTPDPAHYRLDALAADRNRSITIQDDDVLPVITPSPRRTPRRSEIGKTTAMVAIRRTGPTRPAAAAHGELRHRRPRATPGVDYAALPTSVTIQNGKHAAFLTVHPFDDAIFEGNARPCASSSRRPATGATCSRPTSLATGAARWWSSRTAPLVTLLVTDPLATSDPSDTAQFVLFRTGPTTSALNVHLQLGGTAANGTDYARLASTLTIPAGKTFIRVIIRGLSTPISPSPTKATSRRSRSSPRRRGQPGAPPPRSASPAP